MTPSRLSDVDEDLCGRVASKSYLRDWENGFDYLDARGDYNTRRRNSFVFLEGTWDSVPTSFVMGLGKQNFLSLYSNFSTFTCPEVVNVAPSHYRAVLSSINPTLNPPPT